MIRLHHQTWCVLCFPETALKRFICHRIPYTPWNCKRGVTWQCVRLLNPSNRMWSIDCCGQSFLQMYWCNSDFIIDWTYGIIHIKEKEHNPLQPYCLLIEWFMCPSLFQEPLSIRVHFSAWRLSCEISLLKMINTVFDILKKSLRQSQLPVLHDPGKGSSDLEFISVGLWHKTLEFNFNYPEDLIAAQCYLPSGYMCGCMIFLQRCIQIFAMRRFSQKRKGIIKLVITRA